ncbi:MAG: hypothetical protein HYZ42_11800 [Bacteroidetes bacterium]|nr:hypothetical protein [Bacteroidota bacterium]
MKTISALFILFTFLFSAKSYSQNNFYESTPVASTNINSYKKPSPPVSPEYKNILSFYPMRAFANYIMLGYERQISEHKSIRFIAGYCYYNQENFGIPFRDLYDIKSTRLELQYKYFLSKKATMFDGWYLGTTIGFKRGNMNLYNPIGNPFPTKATANSMIAGVIMGYQIKFRKDFFADLYIGEVLQKANGDYISANYTLDGYTDGVKLLIGFNVGFGF